MEALTLHHRPLHLSLNHRRPSFPPQITSVRPSLSPSIKPLSVRASSSPKPPSAVVKITCTGIAAAVFFLGRFQQRGAGAPVAVAVASEVVSEMEELQKIHSEMEEKIKASKLEEALELVEKLMEAQPEEMEWPLLKANLHSFMEQRDLAVAVFEDILKKEPLRIEAFHGLVMAASESEDDDPEKMKGILRRIVSAMKQCREKSEVRDFKLLVAQVTLMESDYEGALKLYKELEKEEPRDFRPHLCQGMIYTILRNPSEADKHFQTFRRLIPKDHPYRDYFNDNMFATKLYSHALADSLASSASSRP